MVENARPHVDLHGVPWFAGLLPGDPRTCRFLRVLPSNYKGHNLLFCRVWGHSFVLRDLQQRSLEAWDPVAPMHVGSRRGPLLARTSRRDFMV